MNETFDKERVLSKVRKMLALANDKAASEGERDNALRMAHNTLGARRKKDAPYMRGIAMAIGELFFCDFFYSSYGLGEVQYSFVGKTTNVATAIAMTDYVIKSVRAEALQRSKSAPNPNQYRRSFAKGAAAQVSLRCREIRRQAEAASTTPSSGTSLVLASLYEQESLANRAWLVEHVPGIKVRKNRERSTDYSAFGDGREYGSRIGLTPQVGGKS